VPQLGTFHVGYRGIPCSTFNSTLCSALLLSALLLHSSLLCLPGCLGVSGEAQVRSSVTITVPSVQFQVCILSLLCSALLWSPFCPFGVPGEAQVRSGAQQQARGRSRGRGAAHQGCPLLPASQKVRSLEYHPPLLPACQKVSPLKASPLPSLPSPSEGFSQNNTKGKRIKKTKKTPRGKNKAVPPPISPSRSPGAGTWAS